MTASVNEAMASTAPSEFISLIPWDFAREHLVLSHGTDAEGCEQLWVADVTPWFVVHNIGVRLNRPVATETVDAAFLAQRIDDMYRVSGADTLISLDERSESDGLELVIEDSERDLLSTGTKGDVAKYVDALLFDALSRNASDIHIQPTAEQSLVRYRIDGVLVTVRTLMRSNADAIVSRVKVLAELDIAEQRLPQDGRISVSIGKRGASGRSVDLRISTLPSSHGERVVIRLLDNERDAGLQTFEKLGMPSELESQYKDAAGRSNGIVLVTGPTGSGKSTTLYTTLRWISSNRPGSNIMTIEDPIEFDLSDPGISVSQTQVNTRKGMTFPRGLRHILRQDPDVVMIGEIRDTETARIAIQASLTGHLVFSTLHTNDAASAITRLIDLGIERYLVSASLSCVLAQRLVRRLHQSCSGNGCPECLESGYRGRVGLFELLTVSQRMRDLISGEAQEQAIRADALENGMITLLDIGKQLVQSSITDEIELARVVQGAA